MKIIPLTQGMIAIVDDEDYERLNQFKWHACKCPRKGRDHWHAGRQEPNGTRQKSIYMHREILGVPSSSLIDHIHCDDGVIDNRKRNLRVATQQQNTANQRVRSDSKWTLKGASVYGRHGKWRAKISSGGQRYHLGVFDTEEEAALAYDAAARILFGEFAHTNFPYVFVV